VIEWLGDWIKQIVILILIATFLDLLLPSGAMDRYVKLVMGLLIILAILSPVFRILERKLDPAALELKSVGNSTMEPLENIRHESNQLKDAQSQQIREEAERKLERTLADQVSGQFGVEVMGTNVTLTENEDKMLQIRGVELLIHPREAASSGPSGSIRPVEPVAVDLGKDPGSAVPPSGNGEQAELTRRIARWVTENWHLQEPQVHVKMSPAF
jgi:stage III sporulation protein AF